jgi:DNA-binding MurR/RpiR family transcriptional regulator
MIRPFAHQIRLRGAMLSNSSMLKLAKADGFEGISDFFKFFQERYGQEELTDFQLIEFSITGCMEE